MKAREVKRAKLANRYAHKREEIAAKVKSGEMDHEEAWQALAKLPRNSNPIRQHNRCKITGRPKGYIRLFGISRAITAVNNCSNSACALKSSSLCA